MYREGQKPKTKRRRWLFWLILLVLLSLLGYGGYIYVKNSLKPDTRVTQSKGIQTVIRYDKKTKHYDEPDFGIDLPATWQPVTREAGPYQTYTWQTSDRGTNGQLFQIFEDTIPVNFVVNRALIVAGEGDHMTLNGEASDNCVTYTKGVAQVNNNVGAIAKWQGVDFRCDTSNQERTVVGTSSSDGINTVILRNPGTGHSHKFLFVYTSHSLNPDFTVFYGALQSLKMQ